MKNYLFSILLCALFSTASICHMVKNLPIIEATLETHDPVPQTESVDDPAIYVHKKNPAQSLILGTNKKRGLRVYDLSGKLVQKFNDGSINNIDLRQNFKLGSKNITLIGVSNRTHNTNDFYYIDPQNPKVKKLALGVHPTGIKTYGTCMYNNLNNNKYFIFATSKTGEIVQWEIKSKNSSELTLEKIRHFDVGSQIEACVADDFYQKLYVGEENIGIWKYNAEPINNSNKTRILIDKTGSRGHLVADVEGLALYKSSNNKGYLFASSQGESAFTAYDRKTHAFLGKFQIRYNTKLIKNTDGLEITSANLGDNFSQGLIIVHDGNKSLPYQNFKLVSFNKVAQSFFPPLKTN